MVLEIFTFYDSKCIEDGKTEVFGIADLEVSNGYIDPLKSTEPN